MKIRISFGFEGSVEILHWFKDIKDFPHNVEYKGKKYSWATYDDDLIDFDCELLFSPIPTYDPDWYVTVAKFEDIPGAITPKCQCDKDKHGFANHATWCEKYEG